jgi:hypothetical protein
MKVLIFYELFITFMYVLKRLTTVQRRAIGPEIFGYGLIIGKIRYSMVLFEFIDDNLPTILAALISSFSHADKFFEERIYMLYKLREHFNYQNCTDFLTQIELEI